MEKLVRNHNVHRDRVGPFAQTRVRCLSLDCKNAELICRVEWDQDEWSGQLLNFYRKHPCNSVKDDIPVN